MNHLELEFPMLRKLESKSKRLTVFADNCLCFE